MKNLFIIISVCFLASIVYSVNVAADSRNRIPSLETSEYRNRVGSAQLGHIKKNIHKVSPVAKKPYTKLGDVTSDLNDFVNGPNNANNRCSIPTDEKALCYVRYEAEPAPYSAGTPQYNLRKKTLQCPSGYFSIASFGNTVYNVTYPSQPIAYYKKIDVSNPDPTKMSLLQSNNFSCTKQPVYSHDQCVDYRCGGDQPSTWYGYPKIESYKWQRATWNGGYRMCSYYELAGCPAACSYWTWERAIYGDVTCTRAEGVYNTTTDQPAEVTAGQMSQFSPSTLICTKPSIEWRSD
jgi:hypothetical protein